MKVLVIGGTGMLSTPVTFGLVERGADVTIFHRGQKPCGGKYKEILGDRTDTPRFVDLLRQHGPWDCIVDMIGGTANDAEGVIDAIKGTPCHVVLCSTTTVYARPFENVPVKEDARLAPPSLYGVNKLACENVFRDSREENGFALTIIRPGHLYNESSQILHSLGNRTSHLDRLRSARPVIVHDDGRGMWSSLWADDAATAFVQAVFTEKAKNKIYHIAGGEPFSWNEYNGFLAEAFGIEKPALLHVSSEKLACLAPERTLQCMRTLRYPGVYDCSAAAKDLGFNPKIKPRDGFKRNVATLEQQKRIERWQDDEEYEKIVQFAVSLAKQ